MNPPENRPTPHSVAGPPRLIASLLEHVGSGAPGRTLVIGATRGEARELLRALARHSGRWVGLVPTTLRPVALEIVGADLARERRLLDEFDEQALLEELLDESKPPVPSECRHLHYLLSTPFR